MPPNTSRRHISPEISSSSSSSSSLLQDSPLLPVAGPSQPRSFVRRAYGNNFDSSGLRRFRDHAGMASTSRLASVAAQPFFSPSSEADGEGKGVGKAAQHRDNLEAAPSGILTRSRAARIKTSPAALLDGSSPASACVVERADEASRRPSTSVPSKRPQDSSSLVSHSSSPLFERHSSSSPVGNAKRKRHHRTSPCTSPPPSSFPPLNDKAHVPGITRNDAGLLVFQDDEEDEEDEAEVEQETDQGDNSTTIESPLGSLSRPQSGVWRTKQGPLPILARLAAKFGEPSGAQRKILTWRAQQPASWSAAAAEMRPPNHVVPVSSLVSTPRRAKKAKGRLTPPSPPRSAMKPDSDYKFSRGREPLIVLSRNGTGSFSNPAGLPPQPPKSASRASRESSALARLVTAAAASHAGRGGEEGSNVASPGAASSSRLIGAGRSPHSSDPHSPLEMDREPEAWRRRDASSLQPSDEGGRAGLLQLRGRRGDQIETEFEDLISDAELRSSVEEEQPWKDGPTCEMLDRKLLEKALDLEGPPLSSAERKELLAWVASLEEKLGAEAWPEDIEEALFQEDAYLLPCFRWASEEEEEGEDEEEDVAYRFLKRLWAYAKLRAGERLDLREWEQSESSGEDQEDEEDEGEEEEVEEEKGEEEERSLDVELESLMRDELRSPSLSPSSSSSSSSTASAIRRRPSAVRQTSSSTAPPPGDPVRCDLSSKAANWVHRLIDHTRSLLEPGSLYDLAKVEEASPTDGVERRREERRKRWAWALRETEGSIRSVARARGSVRERDARKACKAPKAKAKKGSVIRRHAKAAVARRGGSSKGRRPTKESGGSGSRNVNEAAQKTPALGLTSTTGSSMAPGRNGRIRRLPSRYLV